MTDGGSGDGGEFREKLETALAEVRRLRIENFKLSPDTSLVEDGDFSELKADAPQSEWDAAAKKAHDARSGAQRDLLKKAGLSDEQIEALLNQAPAADEVEELDEEEAQAARIAAAAATRGAGGRVPITPDSKFVGADAITEHFRRQEAKKK